MSRADYVHPDRGERADYARYLAGMDASMRQKVALTAAHLLCQGRIADMGMGSGAGSHALALLYPELDVVGVDVDPNMVELARDKYQLDNLSFVVGDIATAIFPEGSLDAVFDSSVLHHVTSFSDYDRDAARRALEVQVRQLAAHGVLIVRDFVDPGPGEVWLDLSADDGDDGDDPERMSTAALFERFAREFRSLAGAPGFSMSRVEPDGAAPALAPGRRRYRVSRTHAAEFLLRKDYRRDWQSEVKEEYTYLSQDGFERVFAELGLRVLSSTPIRNPWIVEHRFRDRYAWFATDGAPLDHPPTNYVIVGERVRPGEGVRFEASAPTAALGFLERSAWLDRRNGRHRDLVRRPNATIDILPWLRRGADVHVLVRMSYPRPILSLFGATALAIDDCRAPDYVTEPLTLIQRDKPAAQTVEESLARLGVDAETLIGFAPSGAYYPSPGGIQEEVRAVAVELERAPSLGGAAGESGFRSSGRVASVEARQLLRAAEVGGLPDARLELAVYDLFARLALDPGPWIAETLSLADADFAPEPGSAHELAHRPSRRVFRRASLDQSPGFLELGCARFVERDAAGVAVAEQALEYVVPRTLSSSTLVVAVLAKRGERVLIGVEDDDLPAAQCFTGGSELLVAPAWRLPRDIGSATGARRFAEQRLAAEYGIEMGREWSLGGRYHPSPGVTPEVVHPIAVQAVAERGGEKSLLWLDLVELLRHRDSLLRDAHLRIVALRAAHALGLFGRVSAGSGRAVGRASSATGPGA